MMATTTLGFATLGLVLHVFLCLVLFRLFRYFLLLVRRNCPDLAQGRFWSDRAISVLSFLAAFAVLFS